MYKIAWHSSYVHPVPENHRFPMEKYELLPLQLKHQGIVSPSSFFEPMPMEREWIELTHTQDYLNTLINLDLPRKDERAMGFKQSASLVERERRIVQGTYECAIHSINDGVAFNTAGGTHHAFSDRPEGFCLLNDNAIAANLLLKHRNVSRILILDLDVHQGNGTAEIFYGSKQVYTASFHGKNNYPLRKEKSTLDIELEDGTKGDFYLELLQKTLKDILLEFKPEHVFYQAGVDVLDKDKMGRLNLSIMECYQRDRIVFNLLSQKNIPVTVTMGGGYSPEIKDILDAHCNTFKAANEFY